MLSLVFPLIGCFRSAWKSRRDLVLENLALRQQINVLQRGVARPALLDRDRVFWIALSRLWSSWRGALAIVKPELLFDGIGRVSARIGGARAVEVLAGQLSIMSSGA